jgi:hypothetical protein
MDDNLEKWPTMGAFPFCDHYLLSFVTPMGSVANRNRSFQRPAL